MTVGYHHNHKNLFASLFITIAIVTLTMLHHIQALQQHIPSCSRRVFFTRAFPQHHKASLQHLPLKFTSSSNNRGSSLLFNNQHRLFSTKPNFEKELESKYFEFQKLEKDIYTWWEGKGYFQPNSGKELAPDQKKFVMAMPPPNVTGYLHMGHAIFLALQDIMARYHRMKGASTLWIPGT